MKNLTSIFGLSVCLLPLIVHAQTLSSALPLRYKFKMGERLRYLVMRDPYFADPTGAANITSSQSPYKPPSVDRLTEQVLAVQPDGTATLKVTVGPEPGFEDDAHPTPPQSQTVTVTPLGQVTSPADPAPIAGFLRAFFRLPDALPGTDWKGIAFRGAAPVETALTLAAVRGNKLAVITQTLPATETKTTAPDHDGTLLQTTRVAQNDRIVFDAGAGNLLRQTSTLSVTTSLTMTNRGRRGAADFGHVIPRKQVIQTMTIERKEDTLPK